MLGSRFDLDKAVAAIAAKRELERKAADPHTEFDTKLKAFVDALVREGESEGIYASRYVTRTRSRG